MTKYYIHEISLLKFSSIICKVLKYYLLNIGSHFVHFIKTFMIILLNFDLIKFIELIINFRKFFAFKLIFFMLKKLNVFKVLNLI